MPFDHLQFMLDGAVREATPAQLWVSDDDALPARKLEQLAIAIANEEAPDGFADRPLLRLDIAALAADLAAGDAGALTESLFADAEVSGAALAVPSFAPLLVSGHGRIFLDSLATALRDGRIAQLIGLANRTELGALRMEAPRLAAFFAVHDLDDASEFSPNSVTIINDEPGNEGWAVVVRCHQIAPSPALERIEYGLDATLPGAGEDLQAEGVESVLGLSQGSGTYTIMITLNSAAAGVDDRGRAEEIAMAAVRRLIGRAPVEGESMQASRSIYFTSQAGQ
jgi:hypothetical protein